jgi:hypothetical protein
VALELLFGHPVQGSARRTAEEDGIIHQDVKTSFP